MKIGILGTGMVGETIGGALIARGHDVMMGSRSAGNEKAVAWAAKAGPRASQGTFGDVGAFAELAFNCTSGDGSLAAATAAGPGLRGKILVDVTNPLDFSKGRPPTLFFRGDDSLGEQIQRALPDVRVVKALNTINARLMVEPTKLAGGAHDLFIAGNDGAAKAAVIELLRTFGWSSFIDLGDISGARATEHYMPLWLRLYGTFQSPEFSIKIVR